MADHWKAGISPRSFVGGEDDLDKKLPTSLKNAEVNIIEGEKRFCSDGTVQRAVEMMHYLNTGKFETRIPYLTWRSKI